MKINYLNIILLWAISTLCLEAAAVEIRVYCFYIPTNKMTLSPSEQIKSALYEKLLRPGTSESLKVEATERTNDLALGETEYLDLYKQCQKFITPEKGIILELKGTYAKSYETFSSFYRISIGGFSPSLDPGKEIYLLDDERVLKELGLDPGDKEQILSVLKNNPASLKEMLGDVSSTSWAENLNHSLNNYYVRSALTIAGILAIAWFGPAYVATAVDFLYPLVYQALWGIPSPWGLTYWLVYYPGKLRAVTWAYNNVPLLISAAGAAIDVASLAYKLLSKDVSEQSVKDKLPGLN
jgi:hypothetical protein